MQIELNLKRVLVVAVVVLALLTGFAVYHTVTRRSYEAQILGLQNDVASRDKTIETKDGVYEKLAIQSKDLQKLVGDKDKELANLKQQLDERGAEILTATKLVVKLKRDLEHATATVPVIVDPAKPNIKKVRLDSEESFGPFWVDGEVNVDCQTDTARVGMRLHQRRPLMFSVVVSQDKDGTWRSSTTSSEPDMDVDIALSAVNPFMLEAKWYEQIGLGVDIGIGTNPGFLVGLGAYYQIGRFDVGPRAWMIVDRGVSAYFGAQLIWHPFAK